jgi:hypothetical protein
MEVQTSIYEIIASAVSVLRADPTFGPRLSNKWLPTKIWVDALAKSCLIDKSFVVDSRKFNTAMIKSKSEWSESMLHFDGTNNTGVFRICFQREFYYFFTERKKQVPYPAPLDAAWKDRVLAAAASVLVIPTTRSRPALAVDADASEEADTSEPNGSSSNTISLREGSKYPFLPLWMRHGKKELLLRQQMF